MDFSHRVPEKSEMFSPDDAKTYIEGCDYFLSADDLLLAWEIQARFGDLRHKTIMDAMCGPGRLGRELLNLNAGQVVFHDGDPIMIEHALKKGAEILNGNQNMFSIIADASQIQLPDNSFDLVVCHNSTHQLKSFDRLKGVLQEFIRLTKSGGFVFIADFQRNTEPKFISSLDERLTWTKDKIKPLLKDTFLAAFSKNEFSKALETIPSIQKFSVTDAILPNLPQSIQIRLDLDPVKGHRLDFSPISLRVIAQKGGL